jgi:phosphoglucosamine mutase
MSERLFGTDGIRGVANVHPMTAEMALKVGRAAGYIFQRETRPHTILIGKDTRLSGYMFENALTAGLCSMGVHVLLVGPLPTPGASYIMRSLRADGAIMISASHNPFQDNGIKFFGPDGFKIPDEIEDEIERLVTTPAMDGIRPTAEKIGTARRIDDAVGRYIEFVKATFPKGMRLDGLKIVCDCANGATYKVGPFTLSELGADVVSIANRPDGRNINHNCGSVHPEEMRATVIRERADLGIAFDGDGDRVVMADEGGRLLDGNALLAILATDMLERNELPRNTVMTTVMANAGLDRALKPYGGNVERTRVGDRYVVERMREQGVMLGGEASGHIVMLEHNTTGDAVITALRVLATLIRKDQPMSALANAYQPLPEAHAKVPLGNNREPPTEEQLDSVRREAEAELNGVGYVVIRKSGTEPVVRVMVQHEAIRKAEALAKRVADRITDL